MSPIKGYVRVSSDLELYYEEDGSGIPLVIIPGWIGTTEFFNAQMTHFAARYRTICYDPRGQGRSSVTLNNNNYARHGDDLNAFMNSLNLKDAILMAHSFGCHDIFAYVRAYGLDNIRAIIFIDSPPKYVIEEEGDWGLISSPNDMKPLLHGMSFDRVKTTHEFFQAMISRTMTEAEKEWFVDQTMKTPTFVALLLSYDGFLADFTEEARMIDGNLPVLNVLADPGSYEGWPDVARAWLKKNTPSSEIVSFGLHMMPWENPERFNSSVDDFLAKVS